MTGTPGDRPRHRRGANPVPWPPGFGDLRPKFWTMMIVSCAVVTAFFAGTAVLAYAHHDLLRVTLGCGGAVFAGGGTRAFIRRSRARRPTTAGTIELERASDGSVCVSVPMDRSITITLTVALLGGAVFSAALALIRITGSNHHLQPLRLGSGIFLIGLAAFCVGLASILLASAWQPRRLVLSEHGIHQNNGALDQYLPWQSIVAVDAVEADPTGGRSRRRIPMVLLHPTAATDIAVLWRFRWFRQRTFLNVISIQPIQYPVDGGLIYHTLQFYWQHPEFRSELSSSAAIERMRRGDVLG